MLLSEEQLTEGYFRGIGGFKSQIIFTELKEYDNSGIACIACTQLDNNFEHWKARKRILQEWVDFLSGNPKEFRALHFNTSVPQALFNAACCQENLKELRVKWGTHSDLSVLENLPNLKFLYLGGFRSKMQDIAILGRLKGLVVLHLIDFGYVEDFSPLTNLHNLEQLYVVGPHPKGTPMKDLEFLREMPNLRSILFGNMALGKQYTIEELTDLRKALPNLRDNYDFFSVVEQKILKASRRKTKNVKTELTKMNKELFWKLIDEARATADDLCEMVELLKDKLSQFEDFDIVRWGQIYELYQKLSLNNRLWAAAYVINGGCSDDGFDYFRGWLIAQGKDVYLKALRDPDSLTEQRPPEGETELESMLYVSVNALSKKRNLENAYDLYNEECVNNPLSEEESNTISLEVVYDEETPLDWGANEDLLKDVVPKLYEFMWR